MFFVREQLILIHFLFVTVVVKQADANATNVVYSLAVQKHSYDVDNQFLSVDEKTKDNFIIHHLVNLFGAFPEDYFKTRLH